MRVLADRGVEHEQHGVRGFRVDLPHDADDLFELAHELGPVLQPAGRVHHHHVGVELARAGQRVEGKPGGVGALLALDEVGRRAARPDAQLLDRGGAERVAGGEHDRLALAPELGRELADGRRLAGAVDADDEDDEGTLARVDHERTGDGSERALDFRGEDGLHRLGREALLVAPAPDRLANPRRRLEAEIGLDQDVLEIVERVRVELALGENVGDAAADARSRRGRGRP